MPAIYHYIGKSYETLVSELGNDVLAVDHIDIDFCHAMRVAQTPFGWIIETCCVDEDQVSTVETLVTYTGRKAFLTHRARVGGDKMYIPPRDYYFPIGCKVNLRR